MKYIVDSIYLKETKNDENIHILSLNLYSYYNPNDDIMAELYFKWKVDNSFYIMNHIFLENHNIKIINRIEFSHLLANFITENPKMKRIKNENFIY